ncbi:MAG: hypothetical protein KA069_01280 [Candidatus Saccharimonas sp.]|nr:hypothetical protein [Candidatus Saccharimonas sp.]
MRHARVSRAKEHHMNGTDCVTEDGFHCEMQMTAQIAVIPVPQNAG